MAKPRKAKTPGIIWVSANVHGWSALCGECRTFKTKRFKKKEQAAGLVLSHAVDRHGWDAFGQPTLKDC